MSEYTEIQKPVNDYLRERERAGELTWQHIEKGAHHKQRTHRAGWPDLTIYLEYGHVVFIELKMPGKKLSPSQVDIFKRLGRLGFRCYLCHSLADVKLALSDYWGQVCKK